MKRLGERIKRKRESMQMQLNDLARKVGVSSSALSQIENAKAFPSIVTLKTIADRLSTTVGELIGEHETLTKNPLIRREEKKFVKGNDSGTSLFLLSHHDPLKQMETYLVEFIRNSDSEDIFTEHPGQEFCYILKGKVRFLLDEKEYQLSKGDSLYFNSSVAHTAKNDSKSTSLMLWIITPPNI
jgi:transcriptional regulator with XRE-family HTH domain